MTKLAARPATAARAPRRGGAVPPRATPAPATPGDLPGCAPFPRAWSVVEPGIVPAVRAILAEGGQPVLSCQGHRGYSWWRGPAIRLATLGKPWVLIGGRTLPDLFWIVGRLLIERRGPLAVYPISLEGETPAFMTQLRRAAPLAKVWHVIVFASRRAVLPLEGQVLSDRSPHNGCRPADARPGGRPGAAEAPRGPCTRPRRCAVHAAGGG